MFQFPPFLRVFRDADLQAQFERDGYVVLPFYNEAERKKLQELYEKLHPREETGFYPSTFSKDKNYRNTADQQVRQLGDRSIQKYLVDYKVVCGSFIVKYPGEASEMQLHQDMTLVDESLYTGMNIWCPLIDLTDNNGALYVLAGSHRLTPSYRGASIPNIYEEAKPEIMQYLQPLYLKAGEAIIFDQSIFHYSPPNLSKEKRIVTNTFFTHKDANFRIAWYDKENPKQEVELFEQDISFLTEFDQFGHDIYARPRMGKSLGKVAYDFPQVSKAQLVEKYGELPEKEVGENGNKSLFSRLKTLLGFGKNP